MANYPIWQDKAVALSVQGDSLKYSAFLDNENIFTGQAYTLPGESTTELLVNRMATDYLSGRITFDLSKQWQEVKRWKGVLTIRNETSLRRLFSGTFFADYSYTDELRTGAVQSLARPITDIVDPRQLFITSVGNLSNNGSAAFAISVGDEVRLEGEVVSAVTTTAKILTEADNGKLIKVTASGGQVATYTVKRTCCRYALYYLNAHGGYDSFLVGGNALRTDNYERMSVQRKANNSTLQHGKEHISTSIVPRWQLKTDYLTNSQYQRLHHLLGSTSVYLHDLEADTIHPVVITNNNSEYQNYSNNGRKLSFVRIDVESAQERTRQ